jgi:hypothetical protein
MKGAGIRRRPAGGAGTPQAANGQIVVARIEMK